MLHLKIVLEVLHKHKPHAKLSKCKFVQSELKFLGHIISAKGIQVDPAKVSVVKDWPVTQSRHDMQNSLVSQTTFASSFWAMQSLLNLGSS